MTSNEQFSPIYATFEEWSAATSAGSAYKERIRRAVRLHPGISLNQARGHAGRSEKPLEEVPVIKISQMPVEARTPKQLRDLALSREAYSDMRTKSIPFEEAAYAHGITPDRVLMTLDAFKKVRGKWVPKQYYISPTLIRVVSEGKDRELIIPDSRHRQLISRHHNAIRLFVESGDESNLKLLRGRKVRDTDGRWWKLETDPKTIHAILERREDEEFYSIYREE